MHRIALVTLISLASAVPALAHHAPAVFDQTKTIVIEGTVTQFVWSNPHSWIHMDVVGDDAKVTDWVIEMNPPSYLIRGGWKSTTLKQGDVVSVVANPLRTGEPAGKFVSITLPDGRVLGDQDPL